jgi:hypothetical protein
MHNANYTSTKLCFAYFRVYPRSDPDKRKALFIPYWALLTPASPNDRFAAGMPELTAVFAGLVPKSAFGD